MRTQTPSQVLELQEHLDRIGHLEPSVLDDLRRLAVQLADKEVLPLIGAGGSVDCGMRLARELGEALLEDYLSNPAYPSPTTHLEPDLGVVADEIYMATRSQRAVVEAVGLHDPALWPPVGSIPEHWCGYRVLARLAREGFLADAITLNYDCGYEAGLHGEGFLLSRDSRPGRAFSDHVTVMADARTGSSVHAKGSLVLRKIHGCAEHYRRERASDPTGTPEDAIVIRRRQLQRWREANWALDHLRAAARARVVLVIGFSAQDPVIVSQLTEVLEEVFEAQEKTGDPRVVVVDHTPGTAELRALVDTGLGEVAPDAGKVASVDTSEATMTAALLVLLTELLTHRLTRAGLTLRGELDERLALLVLAVPTMLRWSYLLRPRKDFHALARVNLHEAAERGYVPLHEDPETTVRVVRQRSELRAALGLAPGESAREVVASHGFVLDATRGVAYLPTGLDGDELEAACRPGGPLDGVRHALPSPKLECVIAGEGNRGFTVAKGKEVVVP